MKWQDPAYGAERERRVFLWFPRTLLVQVGTREEPIEMVRQGEYSVVMRQKPVYAAARRWLERASWKEYWDGQKWRMWNQWTDLPYTEQGDH